jgi:hypothetical protein
LEQALQPSDIRFAQISETIMVLGSAGIVLAAQDWASFVWNVLAMQNQRVLKEGKTLDTAEANLAELNAQAAEFAEKRLPILKALGIA